LEGELPVPLKEGDLGKKRREKKSKDGKKGE